MAFRELQRLLIKYKRPETLLESAFFLHYICPAVILPAEWDLISESPSGDQLQSLVRSNTAPSDHYRKVAPISSPYSN
jgi:hypothetical protein